MGNQQNTKTMTEKDTPDEFSGRVGNRDQLKEQYKEQLPEQITISWTDFVDNIQNADASIEYIAAIQREVDAMEREYSETLEAPPRYRWWLREKHPSLVETFSFAIPSRDALTYLADQGPLVELGAWNGYWAYEIDRAGGTIDAYDVDPERDPWYPVQQGDQEVLLQYDDTATLLLCWPPIGSMAYESLLLHDGDVIYIGELPDEGRKGFGDLDFFKLLEGRFEQVTRQSLPSHPVSRDELYHFTPL